MTLEEMWKRLDQHQPFADRRGYGPEWAAMCAEKTEAAAEAAAAQAAEAAEEAWAKAETAAWAAADAAWAAADAVAGAKAVDWIKKSEEQE